jgi:hypothetical protein
MHITLHATCALAVSISCAAFAAAPSSKVQGSLVQLIDQRLQQGWDAEGIEPAPLCSDETFVRRVYLDLAGRIPTVAERQAFLDDKTHASDRAKRQALIETLLTSEDHIQHMADTFDTLLMGRGDRRAYRERKENHWRTWLEQAFRENRPWNEVVDDLLLARPQTPDDQGAVWYLFERDNKHQAIAEAVASTIFGVKIDCAQCHDHMVAGEIEQAHYWGLVAFFNRSKNERTKLGPRVAESAIGGYSEFANLEGASSPNLLTFIESQTIADERPDKDAKQEDSDDLYYPATAEGEPRVPKFSRREVFVKEIAQGHPMVARALVNRVWAMLMGRGIAHPFDQMDSVHDPSHPELLDELAESFRTSGYDVRQLVRGIVSCDAYQREARRPDGIDDPATFAWYLSRPLTAEQFARSMQLGLRGNVDVQESLVASLREKVPDVMPEVIVTPIRESLFLTNNPAVNDFIATSRGDGQLLSPVAKMADTSESAQTLALALLGRQLDAEELPEVTRLLAKPNGAQQVAWAMITSAEFRFNH